MTSDSSLVTRFNQALIDLKDAYASGKVSSLAGLLALLLELRGRPLSLEDHRMFEDVYSLYIPRKTTLKCARQVAKTTTIGGLSIIQSVVIPYFSSLYICPRFEQTKRFSTDVIGPMLKSSALQTLLSNTVTEDSVLKRRFYNGSTQHYSFAFLSCDRNRGITCDCCRFDEVQDINADFIDIIEQSMTVSKWKFAQYSGTPKTLSGPLEGLWRESSGGEWVTKCEHCNHYNIASADFDMLKMIGQYGPICAKCGGTISPRTGFWDHRVPSLKHLHFGLHVPKLILPYHFESPDNWNDIWKMKNDGTKQRTFFNEVLGEAFDSDTALVSVLDLQKASSSTAENTLQDALKRRSMYDSVAMGIDWGGGGESRTSFTTIAFVGFLGNGTSEVFLMLRLAGETDPAKELEVVMSLYSQLRPELLAHDFGGQGRLRDYMLIERGVSFERIFPASYVWASASTIVTFKRPSEVNGGRFYYSIDKTRSLTLLCLSIKNGFIRFPGYDKWKDYAQDFLALIESRTETRFRETYLITRRMSQSDDMVHAINLAHLSYWHSQQRYPSIVNSLPAALTPEEFAEEEPENAHYE